MTDRYRDIPPGEPSSRYRQDVGPPAVASKSRSGTPVYTPELVPQKLPDLTDDIDPATLRELIIGMSNPQPRSQKC